MPEELGRIDRPSVEGFRQGRRLYFVPLVFTPLEPEPDLQEKVSRYWQQVEAQVTNLEQKLGSIHRVYHELVPEGGEEGDKAIQAINKGSYSVIKARLDSGAEFHAIEEGEMLAEFMDWGRCLAIGLQSQRVFTQVLDSYVGVQKKRDSHIAKRIDETLKEDQIGLLLMREGHGVQFPPDMHVIYVAPPALDEIHKWIKGHKTPAGKEG